VIYYDVFAVAPIEIYPPTVLSSPSVGHGIGRMKRYSEAIPAGSMASFAGLLGVAVHVLVVAGATAADRVNQNPAASEESQLRSACAAWGQQILESNFLRSAVYQEQFSRYSLRTKRCYVEIRVQTFDVNELSDRFGRFLYDGLTREMLAFAQIQKGKKSGKVFDLHHRTTSFENAGWDDAIEYIHIMMVDDRR
jgi:hypothetical protein